MPVSIQEFEKSLTALEKVLAMPVDDVVRDASIQRFEFCVELSWKTARKIMGTQSTAPKQVIREMAQNGYIAETEIWFEALEMRNLTSHTYNEDLANHVYKFLQTFVIHLRSLLVTLKR